MRHTDDAGGRRAWPDARMAGGAMAALVEARDWSATALGPPEGWPASLRVAVGICLQSRFPMYVWWGPDLVNLYNDAYIPILGRRHPEALGRSAPEVWSEVWPVMGPQVEAVMRRGEASWHERVPLVVERNGFPEEAYFTWSQSPIPDDAGGIGGVLCVVMEETPQVLAERERDRLAAQRQLALDAARPPDASHTSRSADRSTGRLKFGAGRPLCHIEFMRPAPFAGFALFALAGLYTPGNAFAGHVAVDNSFGHGGQTLPGRTYVIGSGMGQQHGGNLFHSFKTLSLDPGDTLTFTRDSASPAITNVLARVTGGQTSMIDGTIACDIPGANLYLINPAGVVFGRRASINVQGSFAVTTADVIRLGKTGKFSSHLGGRSVFTTANPSAFGFLGKSPASVKFHGRNASDITFDLFTEVTSSSPLGVPAGRTFAVVAGNISLFRATLQAPQGNLDLVSVASPASVALDIESSTAPAVVAGIAGGDVVLSTASLADVTGTPGGRINVLAANCKVTTSSILRSNTSGDVAGRGIDIRLSGALGISGNGTVYLLTGGAGGAGDFTVTAHDINLTEMGFLKIGADMDRKPVKIVGDAGSTILTATSRILVDNSSITGIALTADDKRNVTFSFNAPAIDIRGSLLDATGVRAGGSVKLLARDRLSVSSSTITTDLFATPQQGHVSIDAKLVTLSDAQLGGFLTADPRSVTTHADRILSFDASLAKSLQSLPAAGSISSLPLLPTCGVSIGLSSFMVTGRGGSQFDPSDWHTD